MDNPGPIAPTRRQFMATACAAALLPGTARAQAAPRFVDFAARARTLSGFEVVPRPLLTGVRDLLDDSEATAFTGEDAMPEALSKKVLKALYTGRHTPPEGEMQRFAYADALMYAAIEDSVNVPSYCGGLPAYWAEKPNIT